MSVGRADKRDRARGPKQGKRAHRRTETEKRGARQVARCLTQVTQLAYRTVSPTLAYHKGMSLAVLVANRGWLRGNNRFRFIVEFIFHACLFRTAFSRPELNAVVRQVQSGMIVIVKILPN